MPQAEYVSIPLDEFERLCRAERERDELVLKLAEMQSPPLHGWSDVSYHPPRLTDSQRQERRAAKKRQSKSFSLAAVILFLLLVLAVGYVVGRTLEAIL